MRHGVTVVEHLRLVLGFLRLLVKLRLLSLLCREIPCVTYKHILMYEYEMVKLLYTNIFNYVDIYERGK
jgi:hypothetical protein